MTRAADLVGTESPATTTGDRSVPMTRDDAHTPTPWGPGNRPLYDRASAALDAAHKACFSHPDRGLLGMSHGPFSGVNEALGIIAELESENQTLRAALARARGES